MTNFIIIINGHTITKTRNIYNRQKYNKVYKMENELY